MDTSLNAVTQTTSTTMTPFQNKALIPRDLRVAAAKKDMVEFGRNGSLTQEQTMQVVLERSFEKLRAVVSNARAELGLSEDDQLDTSPEATANRIADFALGAFSKWREGREGLSEEDARAQFASFIGGAIDQGISEARDILGALNALSGDVDANITKTSDIIRQRLAEFVEGK